MANQNLIKLLEALGVSDIDNVVEVLTGDEFDEAVQDQILSATHSYSEPFVKEKLNGEFAKERNDLKGRYFQDAARQLSSKFPGKLTEKEFKEIFAAKGYIGIVEELEARRKANDNVDNEEIQRMLDKANQEIERLAAEKEEAVNQEKKRADETIGQFKTTDIATKQIEALLKERTNKPADKFANSFFRLYNGEKAIFKLAEDGKTIKLMDPRNPENGLKVDGSETKFKTLEMLVDEYVDEYDLKPKAPAQGQPPTPPTPPNGRENIKTSSSSMSSFLEKMKE